jgi:hypothetical protein
MRRFAVTLLPFTLVLLAAVPGERAAAAEEGIELGGAHHVRVTGTIFDTATKRPLSEAEVTIVSPYGSRHGDAGPDGSFNVEANADDGLGTISVIFSHGDYQQKYLETVLRDALRGDVEVKVADGRAHVKAKKLNLDLGCDGRADVVAKGAEPAPFRVVCDSGLTGVEFEVRHTKIAVLAAGPFTLRVESGRLVVRDSKNDTIELRVAAAMVPR